MDQGSTFPKQRHGCLTVWLILMVAANSVAALGYALTAGASKHSLPHLGTAWTRPILAGIGVANVIFCIALFTWKKWGFFALVACTVVTFVFNLAIGLSVGRAFLGLLGPAVLYGVLQIGDQNKGWTQLE